MAHYAFLDENNIVTEVITGIDESELIQGQDPETWYGSFRGQVCKRTSYNGNIRKQFASIGGKYDPIKDEFVSPQRHTLWTLDENNDWQPPTPKPSEHSVWDDVNGVWIDFTSEVGDEFID
jgi:hypothetical protein